MLTCVCMSDTDCNVNTNIPYTYYIHNTLWYQLFIQQIWVNLPIVSSRNAENEKNIWVSEYVVDYVIT